MSAFWFGFALLFGSMGVVVLVCVGLAVGMMWVERHQAERAGKGEVVGRGVRIDFERLAQEIEDLAWREQDW